MTIGKCARAIAIACAACAPPEPDESADEVALYRIEEGDSRWGIAARLSFPSGWHALAAANHLRGDRIREGASPRVPVGYLRDAGLDPYADVGLDPSRRRADGLAAARRHRRERAGHVRARRPVAMGRSTCHRARLRRRRRRAHAGLVGRSEG